MTSLFSRLQKLNKEATPGEWKLDPRCGPSAYVAWEAGHTLGVLAAGTPENAALIVECRNSLPAVLNLIETARAVHEAMVSVRGVTNAEMDVRVLRLGKAVAVFVEEAADG